MTVSEPSQVQGVVGHTPGPWRAVRNNHYWEIRGGDHGQIGDVCASKFIHIEGKKLLPHESDLIAVANARLIAAAPDLLAGLQDAVDVFEGMNDDEINVELLPRLRALLSSTRKGD